MFGAGRQGEVGGAGAGLQTHEAAGDKLAAKLNGPRLDGERQGLLVTQVDQVDFI